MNYDCTDLIAQFRETSRAIWNLGFWPNPDLREVACVIAYEEAVARLFEGMVLRPLGFDGRVEGYPQGLGEVVPFEVRLTDGSAQLLIDSGEGHDYVWNLSTVQPAVNNFRAKFVQLKDWYQLTRREYRYVMVVIEQFDERPDLVGRHALVEFQYCRFWVDREEIED